MAVFFMTMAYLMFKRLYKPNKNLAPAPIVKIVDSIKVDSSLDFDCKPQIIQIDGGTYGLPIIVCVNQTTEQCAEVIEEFGNGNSDNNFLKENLFSVAGTTRMLSTNVVIITLCKETNKYELINTISHESFHAAQKILDRVGVDFSKGGNNEVYAYLVGYIDGKILEKLNL